ncbi:MAG: hypothetical protein QOF24_1961 [Verrucomicrobiota bacterium]
MILTPLLLRFAARLFPARRTQLTTARDTKRLSRIDLFSIFSMIIGGWTAVFVGIALKFPNSWWLIPYGFGWLVTPGLFVVAVATLPNGINSWREYWAAQEQESGMSHRFVAPICCGLSVFGIIATFILYAHRNA